MLKDEDCRSSRAPATPPLLSVEGGLLLVLPECTADGGGGGRFPGDAGRLLSVLLPALMPLRRAADTLSEFFTSDHSDFCFFSFFFR